MFIFVALALYRLPRRCGGVSGLKPTFLAPFGYLPGTGHSSAEMNRIYTHHELAPLRPAVEKIGPLTCRIVNDSTGANRSDTRPAYRS